MRTFGKRRLLKGCEGAAKTARPQNLKVTRSLGLGLDQKAIEAVEKWTFKPGMKDGKAVPVIATIEVNFRLL